MEDIVEPPEIEMQARQPKPSIQGDPDSDDEDTSSEDLEDQTQNARVKMKPMGVERFMRRLCEIIFYLQWFIVCTGAIYLNTPAWRKNDGFKPKKRYPPLALSFVCAAFLSFVWQWASFCYPFVAVKATFWGSPVLLCAASVLHFFIHSQASIAVGVIAVVCALVQALYAGWSRHRFQYASRILTESTSSPPVRTLAFVKLSGVFIIMGVIQSLIFVLGIERVRDLDKQWIIAILASFIYGMQVMKNFVYVIVSEVRYENFTRSLDMHIGTAFCTTVTNMVGSICVGSALVPLLDILRLSARAIGIILPLNACLYCCAITYMNFAMALIAWVNRWGFVHVGVYHKGFFWASSDTWHSLTRREMISLVDSDLTVAFCFFSGIGVGSLCSVAGGIWALLLDKSYASEVAIYGFLIGYCMCRLAMAWQEACVLSCYVAYSEYPNSIAFRAMIRDRIEETNDSRV